MSPGLPGGPAGPRCGTHAAAVRAADIRARAPQPIHSDLRGGTARGAQGVR